jgi:1-deoxy-D-xylulose-5-phosphate reductoisomerase
MSEVVERTMARVPYIERPSLADLEASDAEARRLAAEPQRTAWTS